MSGESRSTNAYEVWFFCFWLINDFVPPTPPPPLPNNKKTMPDEQYKAQDSLRNCFQIILQVKDIKLANSVIVPLSLRPKTVDHS